MTYQYILVCTIFSITYQYVLGTDRYIPVCTKNHDFVQPVTIPGGGPELDGPRRPLRARCRDANSDTGRSAGDIYWPDARGCGVRLPSQALTAAMASSGCICDVGNGLLLPAACGDGANHRTRDQSNAAVIASRVVIAVE